MYSLLPAYNKNNGGCNYQLKKCANNYERGYIYQLSFTSSVSFSGPAIYIQLLKFIFSITVSVRGCMTSALLRSGLPCLPASTAFISAKIESAISPGVSAPISKPEGP